MDEQEARLILQAYRPGTEDQTDPQFAEALRASATNPELARWWAEEQAFDRAIATQLDSVPAPFGLKTRLLAQAAGFTRVKNLAGGILRWSDDVDPTVPKY